MGQETIPSNVVNLADWKELKKTDSVRASEMLKGRLKSKSEEMGVSVDMISANEKAIFAQDLLNEIDQDDNDNKYLFAELSKLQELFLKQANLEEDQARHDALLAEVYSRFKVDHAVNDNQIQHDKAANDN